MKAPQKFGKYLLLERINVGGMAEVFKAKSFGVEGFEKLVAIKRILPNIAEDEDFITMFIDEAKIAVQLNHANIAQIFDLGRIDDSYFIALEFVHGKDLRTIWERHKRRGLRLPIPMAVYIMARVCEGLDYAHRKKDAAGRDMNIVHRDVSPQNVLISYEGEVKIIDFGIAKAANKASKTQAGILKGKFGYMSPEQVRGLPLDARSDIFSAGIVLYELLTGERLFVGESDFSTLEKIRNVEILPPRTFNQKIPDTLERIVIRALSKDPDDRFQTAYDMQEELQRFLITSKSNFSRKDLAAYMKRAFRTDIARELERHRQYETVTMPTSPGDVELELPTSRVRPPQPEFIASGEEDDDEEIETVVWDARAGLSSEGPTDPGAPPPLPNKKQSSPRLTAPPPEEFDDATELERPHPVAPPPGSAGADLDTTEQPPPARPLPAVAAKAGYFSEDAFTSSEITVSEEPAPARRRSRLNVLIVVLAVLAVGLFGFAVFKLLRQRGLLGGGATLVISTTPPYAKILLDNRPVGKRVEDVAPGPHLLEVRADNYLPHREKFEVRAGETRQLSVVLNYVPASLHLVLEPVNARVALDGKPIEGTSPLHLDNLLPGRQHLLQVSADGYQSEELKLQLEPRQSLERKIVLKPLRFILEVTSEPSGARVSLDDKSVGPTPVTLPGLAGNRQYRLLVKKPGYQPFQATIVYDGNPRRSVVVRLKPETGTRGQAPAPSRSRPPAQPPRKAAGFGYLRINSRPWGRVFVDGRDTGKNTPVLSYQVPAGRHQVTIEFNNGGRASRTVEVAPGQQLKVIITK